MVTLLLCDVERIAYSYVLVSFTTSVQGSPQIQMSEERPCG